MTTYHTPVLLRESIDGLNIRPDGVYVDVTFGGGGHSKEILNKLTSGKLLAFDQDPDAAKNLVNNKQFIFCQGNFRFLGNFLKYHKIKEVDGLLADLGVSSHHFDTKERGFTFQNDSPLDMRMNPLSNKTAGVILNQYNEEQLKKIFEEFGEVDNAKRLAKVIIEYRQNSKFTNSSDLIDAIKLLIPRGMENKYLAKVFQALRIEVNKELEALQSMLEQSIEFIKPGGRLVIITYHSLEDRIAKNFIKSGNFQGKIEKDFYGNPIVPFKALSNKVLVPGEAELANNSRARSAKLRIAEKI
jgi:16S rRNA (cytosine1402-N4)-methyltransferase